MKGVLLFVTVTFLTFFGQTYQNECIPRSYGHSSIVCVCNATYCDTLPALEKLSKGQYVSYTSTESGLRLKKEQGVLQQTFNKDGFVTINLNLRKQYQTILGWGGSFTDSAGINIKSLDSSATNHLLNSYFTNIGLEYNLCRVPIGGTDFSTHGYSYHDDVVDTELKSFKLAPEDHQYKIPLIKEAHKLTNGKLELYASAWTAPKWMKHNGAYTGPDFLRTEMYQTWANYFLKFLREYKKEDITFWGITTGNEPSTGLVPAKINSVGWLPSQLATFVASNLGPTLRNSEFSSIKIITIDDQAFFYPLYIDRMFLNQNASRYIDGFGLHWYWNFLVPYSVLTVTHNKYPDKFILATEACEGSQLLDKGVVLGEWKRAQSYAYDIIMDLNNWVTGWVDWNMALDVNGGPTYIDNNVDSPIIVNAAAGEFYKQPMYYALGHFSKFIPKGSVRIDVQTSSGDVDVAAFKRPDNGVAVTLLNRNTVEVGIKVRNSDGEEIEKVLPSKSITTIVYW